MWCTGRMFEKLHGNLYGNMSSTQTLVLASGFGSNQNVWQNLIPLLAYFFNFKIVVFDWAYSPNVCPKVYNPIKYANYSGYADDLVSILDELKVDKVTYIGHSMSAMIGCIAAVQRPQLFEHLILLAPSPRYLNDYYYEGGFTRYQIETLFKQILQDYEKWTHTFATQAITVNNPHAISFYQKSLMKMNPDITLNVAKAVFLSDWRWILPKVDVPTTIIKSKLDFAVSQKVAYYMMEHLGCPTKLKLVNTEGHFPHLSAYVSFFKVLRDVLKLE